MTTKKENKKEIVKEEWYIQFVLNNGCTYETDSLGSLEDAKLIHQKFLSFKISATGINNWFSTPMLAILCDDVCVAIIKPVK
jgi:hypothetical protein